MTLSLGTKLDILKLACKVLRAQQRVLIGDGTNFCTTGISVVTSTVWNFSG